MFTPGSTYPSVDEIERLLKQARQDRSVFLGSAISSAWGGACSALARIVRVPVSVLFGASPTSAAAKLAREVSRPS